MFRITGGVFIPPLPKKTRHSSPAKAGKTRGGGHSQTRHSLQNELLPYVTCNITLPHHAFTVRYNSHLTYHSIYRTIHLPYTQLWYHTYTQRPPSSQKKTSFLASLLPCIYRQDSLIRKTVMVASAAKLRDSARYIYGAIH